MELDSQEHREHLLCKVGRGSFADVSREVLSRWAVVWSMRGVPYVGPL